ncbi:Cytochrome P450 71A1 like [Quillaja saponaria]|uniref:Cytochrome P450 71A1 like n=1 Tax=Quillaja saponaria TaxID=32244 RepID=A0AAD7LJE4_QUISA|nr:Cytochrome P450 71A1 like [Quillaja saponaria]
MRIPEKKQNNNNVKNRNGSITQNGVVITVYGESQMSRSQQDPKKKTKPDPHPKKFGATKTQGRDRRAELLAYSRQLRNAGPREVEQVQLPRTHSRHRAKRCIWLWLPSIRMPGCSKSRWRYERMILKESGRKKRKNKGQQNNYHIFTKLRNMLRAMSCKEMKW